MFVGIGNLYKRKLYGPHQSAIDWCCAVQTRVEDHIWRKIFDGVQGKWWDLPATVIAFRGVFSYHFLGSHHFVFNLAYVKEILAQKLTLKGISVSPGVVFIDRGYSQHAGDDWCRKQCLCLQTYCRQKDVHFITDGVCLCQRPQHNRNEWWEKNIVKSNWVWPNKEDSRSKARHPRQESATFGDDQINTYIYIINWICRAPLFSILQNASCKLHTVPF